MKKKKTVSILTASKNGLVATNAKKVNVWKKVGNSYVFSHVEDLEPTMTEKEFIDVLVHPHKSKARS